MNGESVVQSASVVSLPINPTAARAILDQRAAVGRAAGTSRALTSDVRAETAEAAMAIDLVTVDEAVQEARRRIRTKKLKLRLVQVLSNGERVNGQPYIATPD